MSLFDNPWPGSTWRLEDAPAAALRHRPAHAGRGPQPAPVAGRPGPARDCRRAGHRPHVPAHRRWLSSSASRASEVPDPYFGGEGPGRSGCTHCGGCMVGCRHNAKNTLVKNYLYFAEKWGAQSLAGSVRCAMSARCRRASRMGRATRSSTAARPPGSSSRSARCGPAMWSSRPARWARCACCSAAAISPARCRTSRRAWATWCAPTAKRCWASPAAISKPITRKGIAITSIFYADPVTTVEPVRYPAGSSLMRFLAGPLIEKGDSILARFLKTAAQIFLHPVDFLRTHVLPGWAQRTTILLVMQTEDNRVHMRLGRSLFTLFRRGLVSLPDPRMPHSQQDRDRAPGDPPLCREDRAASRPARSTKACSISR